MARATSTASQDQGVLAPMLATLGSLETLGGDDGWSFEMKWDGVRALVYIEAGHVRLVSRNDIDMSGAYPEIQPLAQALDRTAVLDGEIVSFDDKGRPSFGRLQKRMHVRGATAARQLAETDPAALLLFDLLYLDGESLLRQPYVERRRRLDALGLVGPAWRVPPAFDGRGSDALAFSRQHGLEGIVAKRQTSTYEPGQRSRAWVKIKNVRTQEVVIGGWTHGNGRRAGTIGALLLGVPGTDGLDYVGKVGTGFTDAMLDDLAADLSPLAVNESPFVAVPRTEARQAHWVAPQLVGEVGFGEWTGDGRLRHPRWRGLRPDKSPDQVVREEPATPAPSSRTPADPPVPADPVTPADPLSPYRAKRDFSKTQEPAGKPRESGGEASAARFVVQRHRARRLHYDFRLEIGDVLVSWAVPKGPTLDPSTRRAAFHVEDHPLEYIDFEGVIPAGQYGGGDVIVWDAGTWEPVETDDPGAAVAAGELHLDLHGEKLQGRFVIVRTKTDASGKEQWLLLHKHDEYAVEGWSTEDHPRSVLSGRTNDEVREDPDRLWRSDLPATQAAVPLKPERFNPVSDDELDALDALGSSGPWSVFGRELRVTNLDKVLFPARAGEEPVTKRELLRYAAQIAPTVLPYLQGRALNMHRYPGGAATKGFWHKELPGHAPDWVERWDNPDAGRGETRTYLVVDEPAALVWAANFGALEWHAWTSLVERPDQPTYALIDLDPGEGTSWEDLLLLARLHRTALDHLKIQAAAKVTGRRGIQIWIPIAAGPSFDETRVWVEQLSKMVGAVVPDLVSWKWQVQERGGLARLDYTQNARNKTLVAPYSPRAAAGAPVSAPIDWAELDDPRLSADGFTIRSMTARLAERGDLFAAVLRHDQELPRLD